MDDMAEVRLPVVWGAEFNLHFIPLRLLSFRYSLDLTQIKGLMIEDWVTWKIPALHFQDIQVIWLVFIVKYVTI